MPDLSIEHGLLGEGFRLVAGVDEAGRGPLAGPVVAAAAVLPAGFAAPGLDDSKKLSAKRRDELYGAITDVGSGVDWGIGVVDAAEIDDINILNATHLAMRRAALALERAPDVAIIDGRPVKGFPCEHRAVVKGDSKSLSVAAASVVAKVERDRMMLAFAAEFPEYGFGRHKGYGTKQHLAALREHGPCRIHRQTFAPVAECAGEARP